MGDKGTQIGIMIRLARHKMGLTLEDVAARVGVTPGALSHIESGRRLPNSKNAVLIGEVLGIEPRVLLDALDTEHSTRRHTAAYEDRGTTNPPVPSETRPAVYRKLPIDDLFGDAPTFVAGRMESVRLDPSTNVIDTPGTRIHDEPPSMRDVARWSAIPSERIEALERLADDAAAAIRTLRGLLEDEDPAIRREAHRLLRELEVRPPEE